MSVTGTGDHAEPLYGQTPRTRADLQAAADYARKVGNRIADTSSARTTATTAGKVWDGLSWYETDTGITWLRSGGAWNVERVEAGWAPGYGGDSGATTGNNGGTDGYYRRDGRHLHYEGRVLFGSSAVFGGAVLTGFNASGSLDGRFAQGRGWYHPRPGDLGDLRAVTLVPLTASEFQVRLTANMAGLNTLGTPPQSAQLHFQLDGVVT